MIEKFINITMHPKWFFFTDPCLLKVLNILPRHWARCPGRIWSYWRNLPSRGGRGTRGRSFSRFVCEECWKILKIHEHTRVFCLFWFFGRGSGGSGKHIDMNTYIDPYELCIFEIKQKINKHDTNLYHKYIYIHIHTVHTHTYHTLTYKCIPNRGWMVISLSRTFSNHLKQHIWKK